ncbi:MAG TPA: hypothetical protein VGR20_20565 [Acidimicrobiia bacterium]|jgi:hypothetical protein|nr:hypothetical protein [Acidimicrobiia bacterium]
MFRRRAFITLAVAAGVLLAVALPAEAASTQVQKQTVAGPNGRSGTVVRFADRSSGTVANSVTISATDPDGPGGKCTETWIDYTTKPHEHFNPGVLVNCSGGTKTVSGVLTNSGKTVNGMGVVICEVPNTSGSITRNRSNCRGNFKEVYVRSGRYSSFRVNAAKSPDGVRVFGI